VFYIHVSNVNTDEKAYIQFFDAAAGDVIVGTTTPKLSLLVPTASSSNEPGGLDVYFPHGISFDTAISYACTKTPTGSDDPTTGLTVNIGYK